MKKIFPEYYLGLDIGTDSVGWAVTDKDYSILKFNKKAMWGIRLFEGGETAEKRRGFRAARRRLARRKQRREILQELFAEAITEKDPAFFKRMEESKYWLEDKTSEQPNTLFSDDDYTDVDFHKAYPTIYHLRKALISDGENCKDVRLLYLAIHHILKKRGHFLFEGQSLAAICDFTNVCQQFLEVIEKEMDLTWTCSDMPAIEKVLKNQKMGKREKASALEKLFVGSKDTKQGKKIIALLSGSKVKLKYIFEDEALEENDVKEITFEGSKFEEERDQIESSLEDRMVCIDVIKAIYDWALLAEISQGEPYLSFSKTKVYDKHKKDLKLLKQVIKTYAPEKYKAVFSDGTQQENYCAYIGSWKKNGKKLPIKKRCDQETFCKYIKAILQKIDAEDSDLDYLKSACENSTLLPKQINHENGVIPHQMHQMELEQILKNAEKHHAFLKEKDSTGYTVSEKILKLFKFRIPYYVGPLNDAHRQEDIRKGFCWIEKRSDAVIRPWNFETVVDVEASAENFIRRMTNKCTYLFGEDVIPKNSLLYSRFMVLNELNNLGINGDRSCITPELKQKIYKDVFMRYDRVTQKKVKNYLITEGICQKEDELSGVDGDFKANLKSARAFIRILGDKAKDQAMVENIIKWILIFGEDRKLLKRRIEKEYGDRLSADEKKALIKLNYSGWSRLSAALLEEILVMDTEITGESNGEFFSIIDALWLTNRNLMELLSQNYSFAQKIKSFNEAKQQDLPSKITPAALDDLYVSPAVKRSIWQTLQIVQEIVKITGHDPQKTFIEMARGPEEKKRTESRKQKLIALYKACKKEERQWVSELENQEEHAFRSDHLYLYYTQKGRCMYTGEKIELEDLFKKNIYDVDHIYPRARVKDDSIDNRVLVKRNINNQKSDQYPIDQKIRNKNRGFWYTLEKEGFISKRKLERLLRTEPFTDAELAGFIERQIVETRQSTKAVATILNRVFEKSEIVYVKAGNVSEFRQYFKLIKVREINDYHHAKDAYLNIVVGNVYNTRFTKNPANFIKKAGGNSYAYNLKKMYEKDVVRGECYAWHKGNNGSIMTVKKVMAKNNILFTRYAAEGKGELFDQMILKKGKGQMPIKGNDPCLTNIDKYGGYNKVTGAYFIYVEHTFKKKRIRTMEYVPVYLARKLYEKEEEGLRYCQETLGLEAPKILLKRVKINSLLVVDGFRMHLSSRQGIQLVFKGAHELCLDRQSECYLKKVMKYNQRLKEAGGDLKITVHDGITAKENRQIFTLLENKLKNTCYHIRLSAQVSTFEKGQEKFDQASLADQCIFLENALHLFQCNSVLGDLRVIGGTKSAGKLSLSKKLTMYQSVYLINQSPTGLFEQTIDLLAP